MAFARWSRPIQDAAGNLIPNVWCEVRRAVQGTPLAVLYADRDGTVPLDNPFLAADGVPAFFAIGSAYNVRAYAAGYDETFPYEAVGTGGEVDYNELLQPGYLLEFEIQTAAPPADGAVRANNADLGAATRLFISKVNTAGSSIAPRLAAMAPNGKANKNIVAFTSADGLQVNWDVDAVTDHTDYAELTVSNHSGEDSLNAGAMNLQLLISGSDGFVPGVSLIFDATTTGADPGAGKFRLNHATHASATAAYIDNVEALGGSSITALLDSWDDAAAAIRGQLLVVSKINPAIFRLYNVTGTIVDSSGYRTVTIAYVSGSGTLTDLTPCVLGFTRSGDDGFAPGYRLAFSTTTTDADPGAGVVRFNNATAASISFVYIDNVDSYGNSLTAWEDGLDDVSNANARAYLRFQKATDPSVYIEFAVTGTVTDGTGYRKVPVSYIAGAVPANGTVLVATASKNGADATANTGDLELLISQLMLKVADIENAAAFMGPAGNWVADSFDTLTYVDTAGATNLDTGTAGALKPTSIAADVLLHFNGSNASTTITDSGSGGRTWTASGNGALSTTSPKFGTAALLCDGNGDYVQSASNALWDLTGDFIIDCWVRFDTLSRTNTIFTRMNSSDGTAYIMGRIDSSNNIDFFIRDNSANIIGRVQGISAGISTGTYYHFKYARKGSTFTVFKNGVVLGTATSAAVGHSGSGFAFTVGGSTFTAGDGLAGRIDEFRLVKGSGEDTAFTSPSAEYTLGTSNLTVALGSFPASVAPTKAKVLLLVKEVDAAVAGTDYQLRISRNNKGNWTSATLTERGSAGNGMIWVETNEIDISGQPSGTTIWGEWQTPTGKMVELHGWKLYWGN